MWSPFQLMDLLLFSSAGNHHWPRWGVLQWTLNWTLQAAQNVLSPHFFLTSGRQQPSRGGQQNHC
jgi:hypothetical protein